ncbi:medium-chain fatty acid-CoA ligase faa2, partial [Coemansia aciculifera]
MALVDPATLLAAALALVTAAVYLYYYSSQANQPDIHPLQLASQSSVANIRESPNESPVYRSKVTPAATPLLRSPSTSLTTLTDAVRAVRNLCRPDAVQVLVGEKVVRVSSNEVVARTAGLAAGLLRISSSKASAVAILLPASPEFLVAYRACIDSGIVAVPISTATPPATVHAILRHSKAAVLVTSADLAITLASSVKDSSLTHLVITGELDGSAPAESLRSAATVVPLSELESDEPPEKDAVVAPSDPAYVLYSTDDSAPLCGVVITHANAMAAIAGLLSNLPASQAITATDVFMSTASMANPANLNFVNIALVLGCSICAHETTDAESFASAAFYFRPTF